MTEPPTLRRPWIWPAVAAVSTAVALVAVTVVVVKQDDGDTRTLKLEYPTAVTDPTAGDIETMRQQACDADVKVLEVAMEAWYAQTGSSTGPSEQQLVDDGFLRSTTDAFDVTTAGDIYPVVGGPCT